MLSLPYRPVCTHFRLPFLVLLFELPTSTHNSLRPDFNDTQRQATRDAARLAGLDALRITHEPAAATIAYGLDKKGGESFNLVYHLGGQTSEVTLISIDDGVFEVLASGGNTHLGGEDFNRHVMEYLLEAYESKTGIDIRSDIPVMHKLKREVERAKRTLSSWESTRIDIHKNWSETLTRAKFEELNDDLFRQTIMFIEQVLEDAHIEKNEIDTVSQVDTVYSDHEAAC
jgi:heat shock protein 5